MIQDILRNAIKKSGLQILELSRRSHVNYSTLCRFMWRQGGVNSNTINKICRALGVRLTLEPAGKKGKAFD